MTTNASATDSSLTPYRPDLIPRFSYVHYPPYSPTYLQRLLPHLINVSGADLAGTLPSLTEPTLYALAAAIALADSSTDANLGCGFIGALRAELRWRDCRSMGTDPTGPVRRGRLVQMVTTITALNAAGTSPLQRNKLVGVCPYCRASEFQLFLRTVTWRCFACDRNGAVLEFAEYLLETRCPMPQPG